jgi:hypothetical protein
VRYRYWEADDSCDGINRVNTRHDLARLFARLSVTLIRARIVEKNSGTGALPPLSWSWRSKTIASVAYKIMYLLLS